MHSQSRIIALAMMNTQACLTHGTWFQIKHFCIRMVQSIHSATCGTVFNTEFSVCLFKDHQGSISTSYFILFFTSTIYRSRNCGMNWVYDLFKVTHLCVLELATIPKLMIPSSTLFCIIVNKKDNRYYRTSHQYYYHRC